MTRVHIAGREVELAPPPKFSTRWQIIRAYNEHRSVPDLVFCAALGACWTGKGRPKATYAYDPMAYGAAVLDDLADRGIEAGEILEAGAEAFLLVLHTQYPSKDDIEAAEGNGEPPPESTTG